jgi:IS30 family transposase
MMQFNDTTSLCKGQHLTLSERIEIQTWKRCAKSNRFIAKELGRSHSTINDEIQRGTVVQKRLINGKPVFYEAYYAETGQNVYAKHREASKPRFKLLSVERFITFVKEKIRVDSGPRTLSLDVSLRKASSHRMSGFASKRFIVISTKD